MTEVGKCPICKRSRDPAYRPFCCKRCADIDLAHWLGETYAIPAQGVPTHNNAENDDI